MLSRKNKIIWSHEIHKDIDGVYTVKTIGIRHTLYTVETNLYASQYLNSISAAKLLQDIEEQKQLLRSNNKI